MNPKTIRMGACAGIADWGTRLQGAFAAWVNIA